MSSRAFLSNLSLTALSLAAWAAVAPASAVEIGNSKFSLTFGNDWAEQNLGENDSSAVSVVKGNILAGMAILSLSAHEGPLSQAEMTSYLSMYAASDSFTVVDEGSKTLGGKAYTFLELKKADPANAIEEATRYRFYFHSQGNLLFNAFTFYNTLMGAGVPADIEAALATLEIKAAAALRSAREQVRPRFRPSELDALGRFRQAEGRRTPLFRVPAF
jgi:hypothetical protein